MMRGYRTIEPARERAASGALPHEASAENEPFGTHKRNNI